MSEQAPTADAGRLEASVRYLAGKIGERNVFRPAALAAAADYIEARWQAQGYHVTRQWYDAAGVRCANLEVTRSGRDRARGILLIGAHYDTVPGSPGADDNASGVAALLEIAGLFTGLSPSMTVRFVAFTNEEPPFFMGDEQGSMVYAKAARTRGDDIRLMISLEMLGFYRDTPHSQTYPPLFRWFYPDRGNFLGFVGNLRSRGHARCSPAFPRRLRLSAGACGDAGAGSGHELERSPLVLASGYRAFMATDTAFYRNPYYHTARDTPDTITYPAFAHATQGLYRCFAAIASES